MAVNARGVTVDVTVDDEAIGTSVPMLPGDTDPDDSLADMLVVDTDGK